MTKFTAMKKVLIAGASGLIWMRLTEFLLGEGYNINLLVGQKIEMVCEIETALKGINTK